MAEFTHAPVLLNECIEGLDIKPDGIYVDGTLGRAGHSSEIIKRLEDGRLIGIDRDMTAIIEAGEKLRQYGDRFTAVHGNFSRIGEILDDLGIDKVDGMLFDLGVSSPQLDDGERGFSYMTDAPLDMRMDRDQSLTAYEIVNTWPEEELRRILFDYGEERYSPKIAAEICRRREKSPIGTTTVSFS
jgi:16S rRNA (cytosine1402-N4)-methyltransferase